MKKRNNFFKDKIAEKEVNFISSVHTKVDTYRYTTSFQVTKVDLKFFSFINSDGQCYISSSLKYTG